MLKKNIFFPVARYLSYRSLLSIEKTGNTKESQQKLPSRIISFAFLFLFYNFITVHSLDILYTMSIRVQTTIFVIIHQTQVQYIMIIRVWDYLLLYTSTCIRSLVKISIQLNLDGREKKERETEREKKEQIQR